MAGDAWFLNSPKESLGFILADQGFDVWVGNVRGTRYSYGHITLSETDKEYWDWSWQDLAMYDLAMIQYLYSNVNSKIFLVGHSEGTIMSFAALTQPHVAGMVEAAALLCPISYLDHVTAPLVERMVFMHLDQMVLALGLHQINFRSEMLVKLVDSLCEGHMDYTDFLTSLTGLFQLNHSNPHNAEHWHLGTWFSKIHTKTYVWILNRDRPLSTPMGTIRLSKFKVVLLDQSNIPVWSTQLGKESKGSPIVAEIHDNGNFVIRYSEVVEADQYLWQSFHYPTDILLQGMQLVFDFGRDNSNNLSSWRNINDPSRGNYSFGIQVLDDLTNIYEFFVWSNGKKINRTPPLVDKVVYIGVPLHQPSMVLVFTLLSDSNKATCSFTVSDSKYPSILKLSYEGLVLLQTWNKAASAWSIIWIFSNSICDMYKTCGPYTICTDSLQGLSHCQCLRGFEPKNSKAWALQNTSDGCVRKKPLKCNFSDFFTLTNIKLPDTTQAVAQWGIQFDECKHKCLTDCTCSAFATIVKGENSSCLRWTGELLDIEQYTSKFGDKLHVKQVKDKKATSKLIIGLSVFALGCIIIVIIFCYRMRARARARGAQTVATTSTGEDIVQNLELPLISFQTIIHATDNFSVSNKLGTGGFGIVYKGMLNGQEIAVKRLSKTSDQGDHEFRNEASLIAKVQHVNLVKLIGYSVSSDEKILIYEYLENLSLDSHLFDNDRSSKLNWGLRFRIICGIARGLLYLHQDSRCRIIHRDLKPSNVLLDKDMTPKISDFGMARIFGRDETEASTRRVVGTYGYMAPEYAMDGIFSVKSDVFSYGVMLLEIISGKKNKATQDSSSLLSHVWQYWKQGKGLDIIDPIITDSSSTFKPDEILRCINIGLLCVQDAAEDRPTMSSVVLLLESETTEITEPKQPAYGAGRFGNASSSQQQDDETLNQLTVEVLDGR